MTRFILLFQSIACLIAAILLLDGHLQLDHNGIIARLCFAAIFFLGLLSYLSLRKLFKNSAVVPQRFGSREEKEMYFSEKQRLDFVASVSHELRTPLTSIKGYAEAIALDLQGQRTQKLPSYVNIIQKNADRLLDLSADLLSLGKIESAQLKKHQCSVHSISTDTLHRLEGERQAKGHVIDVKIESDHVCGDERMVSQVLGNLLENAIRYLPPMGQIRILWKPEPAGVLLSVRDNGPGITAEHHEHLFDRFYRVDSGRSREEGGTGLGLSLVKQIMLKHNGKVWLESRPGEGAEFHCFFPNE